MRNILYFNLVKLKNASLLKKNFCLLQYNILLMSIIKLFYKEGFIQSFSIQKKNVGIFIYVVLRVSDSVNTYLNIKFVSKPSNSRYLSYKNILMLNERGCLYILSTAVGILPLHICKQKKIGGKVLFVCF